MSANTGTALASTTPSRWQGTCTRYYHLSSADAGGHQGRHAAKRCRYDADAVLGAVHGGEALFEFGDLWTVELAPFAQRSAAQQPRLLRLTKIARR